jgi:hypothetical protein
MFVTKLNGIVWDYYTYVGGEYYKGQYTRRGAILFDMTQNKSHFMGRVNMVTKLVDSKPT